MRKVYQDEKSSFRLPIATILGVGITATLFGILPFSHMVNKPARTLELRRAGVLDVPPPVEDQAPPPVAEPQKPPEAPPAPQLTEAPQQIPISADLEVAAGGGGALAGFGEIRALTAAEVIQQDAFDVSELEKRPEPVAQVPPQYPPELRKARIEGLVTVAFVLNEDGRVEDPRVEASSRAEFEKPALEAIRKWRFRPGIKEGKAVRSFVRVPIRFRVANNG
jgi:protein TonB